VTVDEEPDAHAPLASGSQAGGGVNAARRVRASSTLVVAEELICVTGLRDGNL